MFNSLKRAAALLAVLLSCQTWAADSDAKMTHAGHRPALGASALFAANGDLLVVTKQADQVMLHRSKDDGLTWTKPLAVNTQPEPIAADGQNRPKLAVASDGALLVSWTQPLPKPYTGAVRLARSADGLRFDAPITVHKDKAEITHRFETMLAMPDNRVLLAWIDKRDGVAAKEAEKPYRGAGIYAAMSSDGGKTFAPEFKLADHSCECCRLASTLDRDGQPLLMWRHVFEPNERDHALVKLSPEGKAQSFQRATFERWKLDGCPHHGPSLVVDAKGVKHAVWFNQREGEARVFYGRLVADAQGLRVDGQRTVGGKRAAHADIGLAGDQLAVAWIEFDGENNKLMAMTSSDGGQKFSEPVVLDQSADAVGVPSVIAKGGKLWAFWQTAREGLRVRPMP